MEGLTGDIIEDNHLFFILGASDGLYENLRKTAVRVSMRLSSSMEYLLNMPVSQFLELVEDILEADEEAKRAREEAERVRRQRRKR